MTEDQIRDVIARWRVQGSTYRREGRETAADHRFLCADELEALLAERPRSSEPELLGEPEVVQWPKRFAERPQPQEAMGVEPKSNSRATSGAGTDDSPPIKPLGSPTP